MLNRVAENLYWLGHHLERAENVARMARADHEASLESRRLTTTASAWDGLLSATGAEEAYATAHEVDPTLSVADFLILGENENSLRATVARARWLARGLREHITPEAWEEINSLHLDLAERRHFVATQTSASAVGPPVDTLVYHRGTYQMTEHRFTVEDLAPIAAQWGGAIEAAVEQAMPTIAWHVGALGIQTGPDGAVGWPTVAGNPMFTPDPQFRPQPPFTPEPQFTQDPQFRPQPPFTPGQEFTPDPQFRPPPPFTPGPQFTQDPQFTAQPPFAPEPWQHNPSEP